MEIPHPPFRRDGIFFDVQAFRLDLYRLLCCFYASGGFSRLRDTGDFSARELGEVGGEFEEFEITRLLVSIAASVRVIQDRDRELFKKLKTNCGRLIPDLRHPRKYEPLPLREACNKIIHAKRFNFDVRRRKQHGPDW